MKHFKQNARYYAGATFLALSTSPVMAQTLDGSGILAGLTELAVIAGTVVAGLVAFGVAWFLGKKLYQMTKV